MENAKAIATIIFKYIRQDLTPAENDLLQEWIHQAPENRMFFEECTQTGHLFLEAQERQRFDQEIEMEPLWQRLTARGIPTGSYQFTTSTTARRRVYAVAVLLIIAIMVGGIYLALQRNYKGSSKEAPAVTKKDPNNLAPGINYASLTLANGANLLLDSARKGLLATEVNTKIVRNTNGSIEYRSTGNGLIQSYNTLTVPRGSNVVQLSLSDGTKVWLNAASSLRYPVTFNGKERRVEVTGEAYFEVAHNAAAPFTVTRGHVAVAVLGTHFNVRAYKEEQIKVTLLEGSVAVSAITDSSKDYKTLTPGQQAVIDWNNKISINKNIDEQAILAWKNGQFLFAGSSVDEIVHELERWYDVSITCDSSIKEIAFVGALKRSENAAMVLRKMAATETFKYRIAGRTITLIP